MLFINYHGQDYDHPDIGKNINEIGDKEEITYQKNLEIEPTDGRGLIFSILVISIITFFIFDNYYKSNSQNLKDDITFLLFFIFSILSVVAFLYLKTKKKLKVIFVMRLYLIGKRKKFS